MTAVPELPDSTCARIIPGDNNFDSKAKTCGTCSSPSARAWNGSVRSAGQHVEQILELEGLGQELNREAPQDASFVFAADGDHPPGTVWFGKCLDMLEQLESVHLRHV